MKKLTAAAFAALMLTGSVGASAGWLDDLVETLGTGGASCDDSNTPNPVDHECEMK